MLPCPAAAKIKTLTFPNVAERAVGDAWRNSPAFMAYRGTAWMPEPCRSCDRREIDHGGCRCQAFLLAGDAGLTDPACVLSPHHDKIVALRDAVPEPAFAPRRPEPALVR
jgi:pyrroloquinoline quinone biosynthesis protein E